MTQEFKKNLKTQSNVHVLPLRSRKTTVKKSATRTPDPISDDFADLAINLEKRIAKMESTLKESMQLLEHDIEKAIRVNRMTKDEKGIRAELETLATQLESRVRKTLSSLQDRETNPHDADRLDSIKRLSTHLIKILSFDFYKSVLDRLGTADYSEEVDPFGMDRRLVQKIKPIFDFMYYRYWRISTTGIENIPNEGRALIVANHSGTVPYDGAMIKMAIMNEHPVRKDSRFLVENFVYHMPMLGTFMYRIGAVRACPENAELLLNAEHLVIVFPEGVKGIGKYYKQRYRLQRFGRGGFIKLCMKTKSPLIPVGVVGAEEIHPIMFKSNIIAKTIGLPYIPITPTFPLLGPLGCIPLPTKWSIHFGKPISFSEHPEEAMEDELLIHKLSEKVRNEIQDIIIKQLRHRRSVWTG